MKKLAINGGDKIRTKPFSTYKPIGWEERKAVKRVLKSQILTGYQGNNSENFYGGREVLTLETEFKEFINSSNAIPCNSATSGLHIACGAIGLKPGDEVIVSPYSMTCSATAPLVFGAIPVFADVDPNTYCLDYESVKSKITSKTKAVIVVDLFGCPCDIRLRDLCDEKGIILIEDSAQAIGAITHFTNGVTNFSKMAGMIGHIGVFSFNQGKHITCGEGGIIVTDDNYLGYKCRLVMNHAEAVVNDLKDQESIRYFKHLNPLYGFNMRMTEINAAIVREQLKKLPHLLGKRLGRVCLFETELSKIPGIEFAELPDGVVHTFYVQAFKYDQTKMEGVHRDKFIEAVKAELVPAKRGNREVIPIGAGYIKPINKMPIFDEEQDLPVVTDLYKNTLFLHHFIEPHFKWSEIEDVIDAFHKVASNLGELK